jgi:hypothetical protein
MFSSKLTLVSLTMLAAVWACGCSRPTRFDATLSGTVTVDGELASGGSVVFYPVAGGAPGYGRINRDGTFAARVGMGHVTDDSGTLPAGEYIATVVVPNPVRGPERGRHGPSMVPGLRLSAAKYADRSTSDLRVVVKPGQNFVAFTIDGASEEDIARQLAAMDAARQPSPVQDAPEPEPSAEPPVTQKEKSEEADDDSATGGDETSADEPPPAPDTTPRH